VLFRPVPVSIWIAAHFKMEGAHLGGEEDQNQPDRLQKMKGAEEGWGGVGGGGGGGVGVVQRGGAR
jgi:hypothetical protein